MHARALLSGGSPLRFSPGRIFIPVAVAIIAALLVTQPFTLRVGIAAESLSRAGAPSLPQHYVVLLVIDGGQGALLSKLKLPHIDALMKGGTVYDRAYVGQMSSVTPSVHVTLGTGTLPSENGFLGFSWVTPVSRQAVDFRTLLADGQIDPVLKALPVPSVAARLQSDIPGAVAIAGSGHKDYAAVGLGGGSADYVLYGRANKTQFVPTFIPGHTPPPLTAAERKSLTIDKHMKLGQEDSWAFKYALTVAAHVKPRLMMINLPEFDTWGHWYGPADHKVFDALMENIDRGVGQIENIYRKLGILSRTDFILTADHSMMESRAVHNWHDIQLISKAAGAPTVRADGDAGTIWLADPAKAQISAQAIVRAQPAHVDAVFYRSSTQSGAPYVLASPTNWLTNSSVAPALQQLVDTTAGPNGPDVWVLYRESYTAVPKNVSGAWHGTHGGTTWKVQHIPLVMSGPGIKAGVHSQFPARSIDIAPTMERLLGLSP